MLRRGVVTVCLAFAASACDRFTVADFSGSKLVLTISGASKTPAGQHLELWARDGEQGVLRLLYHLPPDLSAGATGYSASASAYIIHQTVDLNDPCMIDNNGHLLWKPEAQIGPTDAEKALQALSVERRIHQLTDTQPTPLLALTSYDDASAADRPQSLDANAPNYLAPTADATERLSRCKATFWAKSPYAYTGNPLQVTAPKNGELFGMVDFSALSPAPSQVVGGINIESQHALHDLQEIWFTQTPAKVADLDPKELDCQAHAATCRGTVILQGNAGTPNHGIFHFNLASPLAGVSGTAAVYTRLNEDPVQF